MSFRSFSLFLFPFLILTGLSQEVIDFKTHVRPILEAHCFKCHGEKKQKGDFRLDLLSTDLLNDRAAAETWHDIKDVLNLAEMPPEKEDPLTPDELKILTGWITGEIESLVEAKRNTGGRVILRRLNRIE